MNALTSLRQNSTVLHCGLPDSCHKQEKSGFLIPPRIPDFGLLLWILLLPRLLFVTTRIEMYGGMKWHCIQCDLPCSFSWAAVSYILVATTSEDYGCIRLALLPFDVAPPCFVLSPADSSKGLKCPPIKQAIPFEMVLIC